MKNLSSLMKKLILLIGVFVFGINAVMLTDYLFLNFEKELDKKTLNLKAKIKLGEFIVEDLYKIKADFYQLAITNKHRTREIFTDRLVERVSEIKASLDILDKGGTLKRITRLNIAGHLNDIKYIEFKANKRGLSLETIDIYPKLNQLVEMTKVLNALLDKKKELEDREDSLEVKKIEREIRKFYKASPAFFTRVIENTRRLLFEGENELREIEKEIEKEKKYYANIELSIIIITILMVLIVGYLISKQIDKNNKRLNILNQDLAKKVLEVQKQEIFTRAILDTQSSIVIVNDGTKMIRANQALFDFFEEYSIIESFREEHKCICECFVLPDDVTNTKIYIIDRDYDGKTWVEYTLSTPNIPHKAAMYKGKKLHHFNIFVQKKFINKEEFIIIVSLNDVTHEISHQKRLKILNSSLKESIKDVKNLLNNANQGFLSFSKDFIIKKQYSKECLNFFVDDIAGKNIATLLYPNSIKKRDFFTNTLTSINFKDNKIKNSAILSLLDSELFLNHKIVSIEYKMLTNSTYMLILTNIIEKRVLEKKVNKERRILKMVVECVSEKEEFFELLDDYKLFINKILNYIKDENTPLDNHISIYRAIHTFKGLFLQKELIYTPHFLHKLETSLTELVNEENFCNKSFRDFIKNIDFDNALYQDLNILTEVLGEDFFLDGVKLKIKEEDINKIEEKILEISQKEDDRCLEILEDIKSLKNRPLIELFKPYIKLVNQLSERLNKSIYPLDIIIDKNLCINLDLKPFINSLVHIFKNSVDHGIETPEVRYLKQKDEVGTISCNIYKEDLKLHIIISDDGAGIDIQKLKENADKLNINTEDLTYEELLNLIFYDKLSVKEGITYISGRGVGLSAVKEQLDILGGIIKIKTQKDKGTTFHFEIPI